tara:strand:+ start:2239 stop:4443 length:2205 start_codon:yes stop_codon:yes gene_type:complete
MSFNMDDYKPEKKAPEYNFVIPARKEDHYPNEISNLMQYSDTAGKYFVYRNYHNEICFFVRRKEPDETNDGKKKITPYSFDEKSMTWKTRAWPSDRVLYKEEDLKLHPKKPVVVHEGEKAVNAAEKLLPDYIHVSWQGGSNACHLTNFRWLKDREVILWPDHDEEGIKAIHHVAKILIEKDITSNIQIVELPKDLPEGWDVADQIEIPYVTVEAILNSKKEFIPDDKIWSLLQDQVDERLAKEQEKDLTDKYSYVRDRDELFEKENYKFVSLPKLDNWLLHLTKSGTKMSTRLLRSPKLVKVHSYMTHAGLAPGVVDIKPGQIIGIEPGRYLNNYRPSNISPKRGDVSEIIDYYRWFVGPEEWVIVEQVIAFCVLHPGVKIKWACSFTSKEGGGKGILGQIIAAILGHHNVRTQVSFRDLTEKHSTVLEGKQFIIINELDLSSTKSIKAATNSLKTYITDPTIMINPKMKTPMEIPNFCNFFIYSNEDDSLYLRKDTRRYYVVNIEHEQKAITAKIEENGFKDRLLAALEPTGPGPGNLLYYFQNDVKIPDTKIFHASAPRTAALEQLIDKSKDDITRLLESALEAETWPFANHTDELKDQYWGYSGLIIRDEFFNRIRQSDQFKGLFWNIKVCEKFLKDNCIRWPNGELTKQIVLMDGARRRAYLFKDYDVAREIAGPVRIKTEAAKLSQMSEGELGQHYMHFQHLDLHSTQVGSIEDYYRKLVLPPKPPINL